MADKIKFAANVPCHITLKRDDCWFKEDPKYGKSFAYQVIQKWVDPDSDEDMTAEGYAYLTELLHDKLTEAGAGKGAVLKVTKKEVASGGKSRVEWVVKMVTPPEKPGILIKDADNNIIGQAGNVGQPKETAPKAPVAPQNQRSAPATVSIGELVALYSECLKGSAWALGQLGSEATTAEIQNGAACLFIEANKKGVRAEMMADLLPISDTNGNSEDPPEGGSKDEDDDLPF